ncbi:MAG: hypothetical protein N4A57_05425 [Anaeromicrobium sp.]|jgi:hypothetical protein|uniref:hypothetical protein n=1 Tax=Anaeromicrobium sp. TaxID=1929132 RepID=UPI0025EE0C66|nr:hypothetical protein [Anaeromicrobium sp.]MCT4593693.1 hypothetical protein [Anaeromicrobium sp.]
MQKQIISNIEENRICGLEGVEFVLMTNDSAISKRVLTLLLKRFTLLIELYDKTVIEASYKNFKLIARTEPAILLMFNELTGEEIEVNIADIRIVRVF